MSEVLPLWEPYRPSSWSEGESFRAVWCENCSRDEQARQGDFEHGCRILARTLALSKDDPEYPREWIRLANDDEWPGSARCTAFEPAEDGHE